MRYLGVVATMLLLATAAQAQLWQSKVLWLGGSGTITTEINPASRPGQSTLSNNTITPSFFVGFPILDDTIVRLSTIQLPHEELVGTDVYKTRLDGVTIGVDYLLLSFFGRTLFSGGLGSYNLKVQGGSPPPGIEGWDFGWYVGVGEWFPMSKKIQLTMNLNYNTTAHNARPQIVSFSLGLAFSL
jgi:hypothetical protein